jgi:hypothetical protein
MEDHPTLQLNMFNINIGDALKPLNTAIERASDLLQGILRPIQIKRVGRAQLYVTTLENYAATIKKSGKSVLSEAQERELMHPLPQGGDKQQNFATETIPLVPWSRTGLDEIRNEIEAIPLLIYRADLQRCRNHVRTLMRRLETVDCSPERKAGLRLLLWTAYMRAQFDFSPLEDIGRSINSAFALQYDIRELPPEPRQWLERAAQQAMLMCRRIQAAASTERGFSEAVAKRLSHDRMDILLDYPESSPLGAAEGCSLLLERAKAWLGAIKDAPSAGQKNFHRYSLQAIERAEELVKQTEFRDNKELSQVIKAQEAMAHETRARGLATLGEAPGDIERHLARARVGLQDLGLPLIEFHVCLTEMSQQRRELSPTQVEEKVGRLIKKAPTAHQRDKALLLASRPLTSCLKFV